MTVSTIAESSRSSITTARSWRKGARARAWQRGRRIGWSRPARSLADHANQALERAGSRERITGASLEQQFRDSLEAGDERASSRLEYREPGVHIEPHNVARAERGVALERPATPRAVEDRNQEFKSSRAEVRQMEWSLERVRASIAEVARNLAVYGGASPRSSVAGGADLIGGGADNGECTGLSEGRRGEVRGRWVRLHGKARVHPQGV